MSRWFRHYAGMMRDDKLVGAAIRSKQPVERVVWIWGAILESASEINDDGIYRLDCAEVAYFLRADEADIRAVLDALAAAGRVDADRVVKWSDRQFKSDQSAERQAKYRDKKREAVHHGDDKPPHSDGGVTLQSQPSDAPETDTELETDHPSSLRSDGAATAKPTPRSELEAVLDTDHAKAVVEHRQRLRKPLTAHAARLLAKSLSGFSDPNAAADTMIESGWQKIKPGWGDDAKARAGPVGKPKTAADFLLSETMDRVNGHDGPQTSSWPDAGEFPGVAVAGTARRIGVPDRH